MKTSSARLVVFTGLPATGKTTKLIDTMMHAQCENRNVQLILSNEHEELTKRPNVKPGGLMGCRTPGKSFPIDVVCSTDEACKLLGQIEPGSLVVFDEAQFFKKKIVKHWSKASKRGVEVLVSSPSHAQLLLLKLTKHEHKNFDVLCKECGVEFASHVVYKADLVFPTHLCQPCKENHMNEEIKILLEDVRKGDPFPGDYHTYQPFYDVDMRDFDLVRADSNSRLNIILEASSRCADINKLLVTDGISPTFLDLGCCSGYFSDGMNANGFTTTGVDIGKHFIEWANRLAKFKGQTIHYEQNDAYDYLKSLEKSFDVTSTFATIQWVMAQNDYSKGLECFELLFEKTNHIAVVEMGYNTEEIYKNRISGAPTIDREWVQSMMEDLGNFEAIELHPAGENGIWRDVFVGFKRNPTIAVDNPKIEKNRKLPLARTVRKVLRKISNKNK